MNKRLSHPVDPEQAPGMMLNSACKSCTSKHRAEIDEQLLKGVSTRNVSKWLEATHGEHIPHQGIARHLLKHLRVQEALKKKLAEEKAAREAIEKAKEVYAKRVDALVADVHMLDEAATIAMEFVREVKANSKNIDMPRAVLVTNCIKEVRSAVVARRDLVDGKKVNVELSGLAGVLSQAFTDEQE